MKVFCPTCGFANESGLGTGITCTSCGATFNTTMETPIASPQQIPSIKYTPPGTVPLYPLAIASLVLGIACCIPFAGIGALATGIISLRNIANSNGRYRGREFAIAGIVLGVLYVVLIIIGFITQLMQRHH
jgi:hypothetical protein